MRKLRNSINSVFVCVLLVGTFVVDSLTSFGAAVGAAYLVPVLVLVLAWSAPSRHLVPVALTVTLLIFLGFFFSPDGMASSLALGNRVLGAGLIGFTTLVLVRRQRLASSLRQEHDLSASILGGLPGIHCVIDPDGRILRCNERFLTATGHGDEEIRGSRLSDRVADEKRAAADEWIGAVFRIGRGEIETEIVDRRGGRTPYHLLGVRDEIEGAPCLFVMGVDVGEHERAEAARLRLAAIVDSSDDAIIGINLDGVMTSWNAGAETLFGYAAQEIVGAPIGRLIPNDRRDEEARILGMIRDGETVSHYRTRRLAKDGRQIDISVTTSPIKDAAGRVVGVSKIARDISAQLELERERARLNRLYAALNQVNQAIAWTTTPDELFGTVCRVLVEHGGFDMAWIGRHDPETQRIVPVAVGGVSDGYVDRLRVSGDERPDACGPTGLAFRAGRPYVCNDMLNDPATQPWRADLVRRGFNASAVFPIRLKGEVRGTLSVYSQDPSFFRDKEVALLTEAANDVSFALDKFAVQEAHDLAERTLRSEKLFSDTMIESMPGVLYFYDDTGRFLRWNRNFETVTGYSGEEVGRMRPLDFFVGEDRARTERAIAEVFADGESAIEAGFAAKDGTVTPYFFTGRRVVFDGRPCLVGVGIDLSARRQAEDRLAESERQYRELVEYANSIILRWNADGRITFLNEFGQRFFGYPAAEIVGRHVLETIVPPEESGGRDLRRLMEEICAAPEAFAQNVNENVRGNGERVWISWANRIVRDDSGRIVEFLSVGTDITDRQRTEAALREAEVRFHTLFEQTPVGVVVVDPITAGIVECNEQAARQLGYAPNELCRLRVPDIEANLSAEEVRQSIDRLRPGRRSEFETRHRTRSGEIRDVLVSGQLIELSGRTVIHCVFLDVTERKQGERRLRESEARYRTLFECAPDGIVLSTPDGRYLDANTSACRMLGYTREDFIGRHAADIVVPDEVPNIEPTLADLRASADHHREWRFRRKDGAVFPAEVIATLLPDGDILGMIRDVSERKEAEAERERRHQAEAADRIKSAFLATMSHELRTPLNSIIGFTGIILQGLAGPLNPEQRKQLEMVRTSARHLLALVNDVLDISKIEAGQLEIAHEPFDVCRSVAKAAAVVAPLAEKKGLSLTVRVADNLGRMVGDERRFEQILLNLLGNAVKFTDRGAVGLAADLADVDGRQAVFLEVTDTGIGIRPDDLANLFQPFRQIDSGLSRNHDGTGLGLAICRRLTEMMGGTIRVESAWGIGSTFSVTLPLRDPIP